MESILNLTQHIATSTQVSAGVVEPTNKSIVKDLLTFNSCPTMLDIRSRANIITQIAVQSGCKSAMLGGAPYLMSILEGNLKAVGIKILYSFSERNCIEKNNEDGTVSKSYVFEHKCFIEV